MNNQKVVIRKIKMEQTWPIRHEVMWPDQPFDFIKLAADAEATHFGLHINEELVSIISLFPQGAKAQFRKFATLVKDQGKGHGTTLLNHIIDYAKAQGFEQLWCNARVDKTAYYERFGLYPTGETYHKRGIDFAILSLKL